MDLVEVRREEVLCDSGLVARKFGQKHNHVVGVIDRLIEELRGIADSPKTPIKERRNYRGREYDAYLIGREFFSLLVMRFKGKKALEWQVKFNSAFYEMEKYILKGVLNAKNDHWLIGREEGKLVRRDTTDVIQIFVEYATQQGSTHAQHYYKHITNATYKALGLIAHNRPKLRDTMDMMELSTLTMAEIVAQRSLQKHMDDMIPYKKIYDFVKDDIERFAITLMIPKLAPVKVLPPNMD